MGFMDCTYEEKDRLRCLGMERVYGPRRFPGLRRMEREEVVKLELSVFVNSDWWRYGAEECPAYE